MLTYQVNPGWYVHAHKDSGANAFAISLVKMSMSVLCMTMMLFFVEQDTAGCVSDVGGLLQRHFDVR